ncbi:CsgG/HfaB family protein [Selenomonas sp. AE3005]|uniref:CsgG/HfaB family protein n=1 Tax=Selenomonas sp. AE3005 TaxID=1485543 RepID=UPI0025E574BC|nr:CsgG/HfaB family protein [Selenomonas sp. AE3005]
MKRILVVFVLVMAIWGSSAQAASLHNYPNIAVLPYANKAAVSQQLSLADASMVSEFVIEQLLDAERFNVIEREMLEAIMKEHSFNMSGMVDPMTAVQIGKLAGVQYLVAGSVTGLSTKSSGASYSDTVWGGVGFNQNTVIANVTVRFIDVETGRIVLAASGTGESASTNMEFALRKQVQEDYANSSMVNDSYNELATDMPYTDSGNEIADTTDITGEMETSDLGVGTVEPLKENVPVGSTSRERKIIIGTKAFSQVQVRNALYKAVGDLIYNKNYGVLAKMDGKAKRRKV